MVWWQILIGIILPVFIYLKIKKRFINSKATGQQVIIEYFDQNTAFETIFPKSGTITETIKVGKRNMFVLDLDTPFNYDEVEFKKIVIAERHAGYYIGAKKEVHVHVLLPKMKLDKPGYIFADFDHVVWATVKPK